MYEKLLSVHENQSVFDDNMFVKRQTIKGIFLRLIENVRVIDVLRKLVKNVFILVGITSVVILKYTQRIE